MMVNAGENGNFETVVGRICIISRRAIRPLDEPPMARTAQELAGF
jgi:hypothetical protein